MALYDKTLGGMKARIASELARGNLSTQIENAINDAILIYSSERLRFSDPIPDAPLTFSTVAGRWIYTAADNAGIAIASGIDYVNADIGTASVIDLIRRQPNEIRLYNLPNQQIMGQPSDFAYEGNQLLIAPVPDQAYLITLGLFLNPAAPADDADADNPWMTDAEPLIRARAKFEIATHVTRNEKMAQLMSPEPPDRNGGVAGAAWRALRTLKATGNRITGTGRIRSMQF